MRRGTCSGIGSPPTQDICWTYFTSIAARYAGAHDRLLGEPGMDTHGPSGHFVTPTSTAILTPRSTCRTGMSPSSVTATEGLEVTRPPMPCKGKVAQ